MRINNKRIIPWVNLVYTFALLGIGVGFFMWAFPLGAINDLIPPYFIIGAAVFVLILVRWMGPQHFKYDSDGEALNFKVTEAFLVKYFSSASKSSEFPKAKLLHYSIKGGITKRLYLTIRSKRNASGSTTLKYNVSFLSASERKDLRRSLRKILDNNKTKQNQSLNDNNS